MLTFSQLIRDRMFKIDTIIQRQNFTILLTTSN